jgi:hypothetical protein
MSSYRFIHYRRYGTTETVLLMPDEEFVPNEETIIIGDSEEYEFLPFEETVLETILTLNKLNSKETSHMFDLLKSIAKINFLTGWHAREKEENKKVKK